jgi:hypothetical protein
MFEGKSSRRKIDASKEKGSKKEETLRCESDLATKVLKGLSKENLSRGFLF